VQEKEFRKQVADAISLNGERDNQQKFAGDW
jgi:hypothetical protein